MPLYEIHHSCTLTASQQSAIASGITSLHCTTFSTPSAFVNTTFHPTSTTSPQIYVGGSPQRTNYILGHLRPRPNNAEKLSHIVKTITAIWNEHARPVDSRALHNVFLMEDIVAGAEQGFVLPVPGKDGEWVRENMGEFERRAGDGDESVRALVQEYKSKL
ncbi:hypothetical protein BU25DRAFT_386290 [Macroventuria anomochaeta]|uniref:Uncharacterized protein n=1 Tax=Macroventuria anomochaeta TaxID=301207 RepID=A0ACB6SAE5_9PLEO|nr:uncharacterized protein BU25DRAFT_386290 [Macroventuria anomochaeta]KAF2631260.1 hypothetical protein BU25DRAFT_386290 [Macroventuria anomochaeta]